MEIGVQRGGESNQICFANVLTGENSKSIAPRGDKAIKNVRNTGQGSTPRTSRQKRGEMRELQLQLVEFFGAGQGRIVAQGRAVFMRPSSCNRRGSDVSPATNKDR
jgi:hypothetical protein